MAVVPALDQPLPTVVAWPKHTDEKSEPPQEAEAEQVSAQKLHVWDGKQRIPTPRPVGEEREERKVSLWTRRAHMPHGQRSSETHDGKPGVQTLGRRRMRGKYPSTDRYK